MLAELKVPTCKAIPEIRCLNLCVYVDQISWKTVLNVFSTSLVLPRVTSGVRVYNQSLLVSGSVCGCHAYGERLLLIISSQCAWQSKMQKVHHLLITLFTRECLVILFVMKCLCSCTSYDFIDMDICLGHLAVAV